MQQTVSDGVSHAIDARGIARIVLDRQAQHNALSVGAGEALARAIDGVLDASPRVVLLTGRGPIFCAGGDIAEFQAQADRLDDLVDRILRVLHPAILRLAGSPVPVVVAINGAVGGAGVGLALCGDFALAAASMKLRTGYAAIGLSPDLGASFFMTRRAGTMRARQLFMTNETLDAADCLRWGIVDAVIPDDSLEADAEQLCARLAAGAPGAFAAIKRLCEEAPRHALAAHLELEKSLLEARARSRDAKEGIAAFLARRPPSFDGG